MLVKSIADFDKVDGAKNKQAMDKAEMFIKEWLNEKLTFGTL